MLPREIGATLFVQDSEGESVSGERLAVAVSTMRLHIEPRGDALKSQRPSARQPTTSASASLPGSQCARSSAGRGRWARLPSLRASLIVAETFCAKSHDRRASSRTSVDFIWPSGGLSWSSFSRWRTSGQVRGLLDCWRADG
jgi:hypothetical protein